MMDKKFSNRHKKIKSFSNGKIVDRSTDKNPIKKGNEDGTCEVRKEEVAKQQNGMQHELVQVHKTSNSFDIEVHSSDTLIDEARNRITSDVLKQKSRAQYKSNPHEASIEVNETSDQAMNRVLYTSDVTTDSSGESIITSHPPCYLAAAEQSTKHRTSEVDGNKAEKHLTVHISKLDEMEDIRCKCHNSELSSSEVTQVVEFNTNSSSSQGTKLVDPLLKSHISRKQTTGKEAIGVYDATKPRKYLMKRARSATPFSRERYDEVCSNTAVNCSCMSPNQVHANVVPGPTHSAQNRNEYCPCTHATLTLEVPSREAVRLQNLSEVERKKYGTIPMVCRCHNQEIMPRDKVRDVKKKKKAFWGGLCHKTQSNKKELLEHITLPPCDCHEYYNQKPAAPKAMTLHQYICVSDTEESYETRRNIGRACEAKKLNEPEPQLYKMEVKQAEDGSGPRGIVFDLVNENTQGICECTHSKQDKDKTGIERRLIVPKTNTDQRSQNKSTHEVEANIFQSSRRRLEIYYFDHGNSAYYNVTDNPPPAVTDPLLDKADEFTTKFWSEIFGTLTIALLFITNFVLQLLKFLLVSVVRPFTAKVLQIAGDYLVKPSLAICYNGIIQPLLIFLYNVAKSIRDLSQPLARAVGFWFRELAHLFRAFRLVEVNINKDCEKLRHCPALDESYCN